MIPKNILFRLDQKNIKFDIVITLSNNSLLLGSDISKKYNILLEHINMIDNKDVSYGKLNYNYYSGKKILIVDKLYNYERLNNLVNLLFSNTIDSNIYVIKFFENNRFDFDNRIILV